VKYVIDIDGTICTNTNGSYQNAEPIEGRIATVNELYNSGHIIILYTARGMGRTKNSTALAQCLFTGLTKQQLEAWGVKYHHLFLGKPAGDVYIDDKGIKDSDFFGD